MVGIYVEKAQFKTILLAESIHFKKKSYDFLLW